MKGSARLFDHRKTKFGIKNATCQIFSQHDFKDIASITFTITAASLPNGKVFGKFIPYRCSEEYETHSAHLETLCLSKLKGSKMRTIIGTCPNILQIILDCPVTSKAFHNWLPLRQFGTSIYYHCAVVFTTVCTGNLEALMTRQPSIYCQPEWLRYVIFTVLLSLLYCQKLIKLNHNDLHCENVLVDDSAPRPAFSVTIDGQHFTLPEMARGCILWDFEFSDVFDKKTNPREIRNHFGKDEEDNIPLVFNPFYDAHVFLMRMAAMRECPEEIKAWIFSKYPECVRPLEDDLEEDEEIKGARKKVRQHAIALADALETLGQSDLSESLHNLLAALRLDTAMQEDEEEEEEVIDEDEDEDDADIYVLYDPPEQSTIESYYDKENTDYSAYRKSHLTKSYLMEQRRKMDQSPPLGKHRSRYIDGFRLINAHQDELALPDIKTLLLDDFFESYRTTSTLRRGFRL